MSFDINEGGRPSLLELGRLATGEIDGEPSEEYRRALDQASQKVKPFDAEILRKAAVRLDEQQGTPARPERGWSWQWALAPLFAMALMLGVVVVPGDGVRTKGGGEASLGYYVLVGDQVQPGTPATVLGVGDRVQFRYQAAGASSLVLLSIDAAGQVTVFWPESGDVPVVVAETGEHLLSGSIVLDDAPGPEAFLGIFGFSSVAEASGLVRDAWNSGGLSGLEGLASSNPMISLVIIQRKP